ncbi:exodeoxyribonuclease V subunit beta [Acidihalobacter ferrooxydans]|uniref:RecBCD enzyme subunit RecB n=1 Tax=Acidihalobacter ferrooxydans TaxID=1765967 RepID=A0A1P8UJK9_9GAMM|nr:exodeoxyribonuclease V subunit beta [Acidihalobacter ferrooxydans]APZ44016.1 exodeoxyribonuclease V subunit beta [Acidihalobacter ferrooxydans]
MTRELNMPAFPLHGVQLIEASAGTGKTYTIANLYLRLVLERGLTVPEILVVTFTKAATEELRGRIRQRLIEARALLASGQARDDGDLGTLVHRLTEPDVARQRLDEAIVRMDEAAVYTIHGFAQRMLTEHAFESGAPFEAELLGDEQALRRAATEDFWRRRFYGAPQDEVAWAAQEWGTPEDLYERMSDVLGRDAARLLPSDAGERAAALLPRWQRLHAELRAAWVREGEAVSEALLTSPALKRNIYTAGGVEAALRAFAEWIAASEPPPGVLPERIQLFTPAKLGAATKKGAEPPTASLFGLCEELADLGPRLLRAYRAALLAEAAGYVRKAVAEHKSARRLLAYDDLLARLDAVLASADGAELAMRIRARFPVAMIDEFQDTDPVQYRIFQAVYGGRDDLALFLIGDPKQAIYGFRGADIFAYLQARRDVGDGAHTLPVNWRSGSALVAAVNRLFSASAHPFLFEQIEFHPVRPSQQADAKPLRLDGATPAPLACWRLPAVDGKPLTTGAAQAQVALACAHEIAGLLARARSGAALIGAEPLRAGDIAILVRNRNEAAVVREALDALGIASVFLSRDSIFSTPEAEALRRVLRAVAEPGNARALRAALATDLLGADAAELAALEQDENAWERWLTCFQRARQRWREHGFMAMFTQLLTQAAIAHRLLAARDGERRMTNLLQLGELLAVAAAERSGFEALLRWLDARIDAPDGEDEAQQLRLDSDESLVQIVTVHASKGLEYPLVFLPFPWICKPFALDKSGEARAPFLFHAADDFALCADLGSDAVAEHAAQAERERLAEDLRLLYVALTRARQRVYFSWGAVKRAPDSALARLLHPQGMPTDDAALRTDLLALNADAPLLELLKLPDGPTAAPPPQTGAALHARRFDGRIDAGWRVTSYSGLVADYDARVELPDYDAFGAAEPAAALRAQRDAFAFPRGAQAGLFLHALLEKLDFPGAQGEALSDRVTEELARHGFDSGWRPAIEALVTRVLDTPLDEAGLCLRNITRADRVDELAFYYPLAALDCAALNALLARSGPLELTGEALSFRPQHGMMKGFIDLVFRHGGRYYLADYKSNHLGDRPEDYAPALLDAAMREHRYDLQYLIYCVALHRHLRARLPDYDYARDFGGVFYLFLRGMRPADGPRLGVYRDRPEPALIAALDRLFAGAEDVA